MSLDREALEQLLERWREDPGCYHCGALGDCHPSCPTRLCGECAGLGMVMNLEDLLGITADGNPVYGGAPCPRGCPLP